MEIASSSLSTSPWSGKHQHNTHPQTVSPPDYLFPCVFEERPIDHSPPAASRAAATHLAEELAFRVVEPVLRHPSHAHAHTSATRARTHVRTQRTRAPPERVSARQNKSTRTRMPSCCERSFARAAQQQALATTDAEDDATNTSPSARLPPPVPRSSGGRQQQPPQQQDEPHSIRFGRRGTAQQQASK